MSDYLFFNNIKLETTFPLRSLFYGEGIFETTRWKGGKPVHLSKHLARLKKGAEFLKIPYPGDREITGQAESSYNESGIEDAYVKICILSDSSPLYYDEPKNSSILIYIRKIGEPKYSIKLCVSDNKRNQDSKIANIKSLNYLENIIVKREALSKGFDDAIILNTKDEITETSANNIFWVRGRSIFTPAENCGLLPGITRQIVMEMAPELGYDVNERKYKLPYLLNSDFAFITNSLNGIQYVNKINYQEFTPMVEEYHKFKNLLYSKLGWQD